MFSLELRSCRRSPNSPEDERGEGRNTYFIRLRYLGQSTRATRNERWHRDPNRPLVISRRWFHCFSWTIVDSIPTVSVGLDAQDQGWPATQPSIFDASGGYRGHRVSVTIEVSDFSAAVLSLQFCAERGPCPDLEVVLDGIHRGLFHPEVARNDRSQTGEPGPIAGQVDLEIRFPAEWLAPGRHTLTITTALDRAAAVGDGTWGANHDIVYEAGEILPAARDHCGQWFGSYIRWSAAELVDIDVTWAAGTTPPKSIVAEWTHTQTQTQIDPAPSGRDFGMFRSPVAVPAFTEPTQVTVQVGDESHRQRITPCRRWTLHLIPHVHFDLGFSDSKRKVIELHCRNIDRALDRFAVDPAFRFCVDGSVVVAEYTNTRAPAPRARDARCDRVGSPRRQHLPWQLPVRRSQPRRDVSLTELALTLPISGTTGLRYANLTDVPTYARSIASVLADLGVDAFVGITNHARAATDASDELHLLSPVRWQGPNGQEVLAHFADNEDLADGDTGFAERWNATFTLPRFSLRAHRPVGCSSRRDPATRHLRWVDPQRLPRRTVGPDHCTSGRRHTGPTRCRYDCVRGRDDEPDAIQRHLQGSTTKWSQPVQRTRPRTGCDEGIRGVAGHRA